MTLDCLTGSLGLIKKTKFTVSAMFMHFRKPINEETPFSPNIYKLNFS